MDIQKIINDKTEEILTSGEVEKLIQSNIEQSINGAIKDKFGGYYFKREIEDKLSEIIDPVLKEVSLDNYKDVIIGRINNILKGFLDSDLVDKVEKSYRDIFTGDTDDIKISRVFEIIREWFKSDDQDSYGEHFSAEIAEGNSYSGDSSFEHFTIRFDEEGDKGDYDDWDYEINLCVYKGQPSNISRLKTPNLKYGGKEQGVLLRARDLSHIERFLLNAFFSERKIIMDITDSGEIDTSKYDGDY